MGGAAGHIKHLHEEHDLTFTTIVEVLKRATIGTLKDVTEKLDGQALTFSWDPVLGLRTARGLKDISAGGLTETELAGKFDGKPRVKEAFSTAHRMLTVAVNELTVSERTLIFGEELSNWFNVEVIDVQNLNVIRYSTSALVLHRNPVFIKQDKKVRRTVDEAASGRLCESIDRMDRAVSQFGWSLKGPVGVKLHNIDRSFLMEFRGLLERELHRVGLNFDATIQDYLRRRISHHVEQLSLPDDVHLHVINRALEARGCLNLAELKRLCPNRARAIGQFIDCSEQLVKQLRFPIELLIHRAAGEILSRIRSPLISDHPSAISAMRNDLQHSIELINATEDPEQIHLLNGHMHKLGGLEEVTASIEGIVFPWDGRIFKLTGSFAPVNQILGILRYDRTRKNRSL